MRVRALATGDREELERLYQLMFPDCDDGPGDVARLMARLPDDACVLVIDREEIGDGRARLGGFVEAGWRSVAESCESSPVPYVEAWYVEPALRGHGWGRALVAAVEDWARAHGAVELASDTQIGNHGSIAAHGKLGFVEVERLACFRKPL